MKNSPAKNLNKVQRRLMEGFQKTMNIPGADRCILCAPTGTGKTGTARAIINLYAKTGAHKVALFLTPRIGLTDQQARALLDFNVADSAYADCAVDILIVHSRIVESKKTPQFLNVKIAENAAKGVYTIIACTYDSAPKLGRIPVDLIICDEAHNVCQEDFFNTVMNRLCQSAHRVFMTATPKESPGTGSTGFNNVAKYGPYAENITPRYAIEKKIIVSPLLHVFKTWSPLDKKFTIVDQVKQIFEYHRGYNAGRMPTKVLFTLQDSKHIGTVCENAVALSEQTNAKVFTIISSGPFAGQFVNGMEIRNKNDFLDMISEYEGDAIVCHYAMLNEGIDVDGFTGICFMRRVNKTTAIQTIGRGLRIYKKDRQDDGYAKDKEYRIKKHALVTLVVYNDDTSLKAELKEFVVNLREAGFDFFKDQMLESGSKGYGNDDSSKTGSMNPLDKPEYRHSAQMALDEVQHELEREKARNDRANMIIDEDDFWV